MLSERVASWSAADPSPRSPDVTLHHSFATTDGARAACLWEVHSIDRLAILEPVVGRCRSTEYVTVEHREGFVRPSRVLKVATA